MGHKYHDLLFTDAVKAEQSEQGSRRGYARFEVAGDRNDVIGANEAAFIAARDSFYMASTSAKGWPYIQHRGGPVGFLRVLDPRTIAFADFAGNRQYITKGNLKTDDRVALFLMDYGNRARLKMLGRAHTVAADEDPALIAKLAPADYEARIERAMVITVEAFDWNCSQHITERYTVADITPTIDALKAEIERLQGLLAESPGPT